VCVCVYLCVCVCLTTPPLPKLNFNFSVSHTYLCGTLVYEIEEVDAARVAASSLLAVLIGGYNSEAYAYKISDLMCASIYVYTRIILIHIQSYKYYIY